MNTGTTTTVALATAQALKNALTAIRATNKVTASLLEKIASSVARFALAVLVLTAFRFRFARQTVCPTTLMHTLASGLSVLIPTPPSATLVRPLTYVEL